MADSTDLLDQASRYTTDIQATVDRLNQYTDDSTVDPRLAIEEAGDLLDDIKSFQSQNADAANTLKCARDQFDKWSYINKMLNDQQDETFSLKFNTSILQARVNDADLLATKSRWVSAEALSRLQQSQANFEKLLVDEATTVRLQNSIREDLNSSLVSQMNVLTEQYQDNAQQVRQELKNINQITGLVQDATTNCAAELEDVRARWLPKTKAYQEELTSRAEEYAKLFKNTKDGAEVALRASSSHRSIVEAIEAARDSADQAIEAVGKSHAELFEETSDDSVIERAEQSVEDSLDIEAAAMEEFQKLEGTFQL